MFLWQWNLMALINMRCIQNASQWYCPVLCALLCSGDTLWSGLGMSLFGHAMNLNADCVLWLWYSCWSVNLLKSDKPSLFQVLLLDFFVPGNQNNRGSGLKKIYRLGHWLNCWMICDLDYVILLQMLFLTGVGYVLYLFIDCSQIIWKN